MRSYERTGTSPEIHQLKQTLAEASTLSLLANKTTFKTLCVEPKNIYHGNLKDTRTFDSVAFLLQWQKEEPETSDQFDFVLHLLAKLTTRARLLEFFLICGHEDG